MTSFQQINFKDEILFNDYDEDLNMLLLASSEKIFELSSFLVIMTKADELTSYFQPFIAFNSTTANKLIIDYDKR